MSRTKTPPRAKTPPRTKTACPGIDQPRLAAWREFLGLHATLVEAIEKELAAAEALPLGWYDVLIALYETPGRRLRMHELAAAILLSPSGLTRLVDRLERAGLLRREPCSDDRRCQHAVLTEAGLAQLRRTWPVYAAAIARHWGSHLGDDETAILRGVLARLREPARQERRHAGPLTSR